MISRNTYLGQHVVMTARGLSQVMTNVHVICTQTGGRNVPPQGPHRFCQWWRESSVDDDILYVLEANMPWIKIYIGSWPLPAFFGARPFAVIVLATW